MRRMNRNQFIIYFLRLYNLVWKLTLLFMKKKRQAETGISKAYINRPL